MERAINAKVIQLLDELLWQCNVQFAFWRSMTEKNEVTFKWHLNLWNQQLYRVAVKQTKLNILKMNWKGSRAFESSSDNANVQFAFWRLMMEKIKQNLNDIWSNYNVLPCWNKQQIRQGF